MLSTQLEPGHYLTEHKDCSQRETASMPVSRVKNEIQIFVAVRLPGFISTACTSQIQCVHMVSSVNLNWARLGSNPKPTFLVSGFTSILYSPLNMCNSVSHVSFHSAHRLYIVMTLIIWWRCPVNSFTVVSSTMEIYGKNGTISSSYNTSMHDTDKSSLHTFKKKANKYISYSKLIINTFLWRKVKK